MSSTTVSVRMKPRNRSRSVLAEESEQAKGEGSVGRHRHAPTVCRTVTGVDCKVKADSAQHPAESREYREDDPRTLSELADVEFSARL